VQKLFPSGYGVRRLKFFKYRRNVGITHLRPPGLTTKSIERVYITHPRLSFRFGHAQVRQKIAVRDLWGGDQMPLSGSGRRAEIINRSFPRLRKEPTIGLEPMTCRLRKGVTLRMLL